MMRACPAAACTVLKASAITVSCNNLPAGMPLSSYMWDLSNPNVPEAELLGPSQLVCAKFNVKDANLVGAGQYNGQFSYFDTRKGTAPVDATPMDVCHRSDACSAGSRSRCHGGSY